VRGIKESFFIPRKHHQQPRKEDLRMQWYLLIGSILLCGVVGIGIWNYAYRLGVKHGQATSIPFRVIDELLDHKIHCLGQDPALARIELETTLNIALWELQSLAQHVLQVCRNQKDEVTLATRGHSAEVSSIS
jgi:hypothetical protein